MTLWILIAVLTALALIVLLRPLLATQPVGEAAGGPVRAAFDRRIYRDQLDEVARDKASGVVSEAEAASARLEIERRLLAADAAANADGANAGGTERKASAKPAISARVAATAVLLAVPLASLALYFHYGQPDLPDMPLAGRQVERSVMTADGQLNPMKIRQVLMAQLEHVPDDQTALGFLARIDASVGDWEGAKSAYARLRQATHDRPDVLENFGEMLTQSADGEVGPEADALFRQAVAASPKSYKARSFLGLEAYQKGDADKAIAAWKAVEAEAPADSQGHGIAAEMRQEAERQQANPVLDQPGKDATPESAAPQDEAAAQIAKLPEGQQMQAIQGMVDGLAARLKEQPNDVAGWSRLARAYAVLGNTGKAIDAYEHLATLTPKDPMPLVAEAGLLRQSAADPNSVPPQAEVLYRQALALDPKQPDALWQLGRAEAAAGRKSEATAHWTALLAVLPADSDPAKQVKSALDNLQKS